MKATHALNAPNPKLSGDRVMRPMIGLHLASSYPRQPFTLRPYSTFVADLDPKSDELALDGAANGRQSLGG